MPVKRKVPIDLEVVQPKHYMQWEGMEPFTFFMLNKVPFDQATVCKYVLRYRLKNGIQDLQKAKRVLDMMIELETNRSAYQPKKVAL